MSRFRDTWIDQCAAAEGIREQFGVEKAIGYLVGEKFLNALRYSHGHGEIAEEIPSFATQIREIFERHELAAWFGSVRRLGPLGHILSAEEHREFRDAGALDDDVVRGGEEVLALERARELLLF